MKRIKWTDHLKHEHFEAWAEYVQTASQRAKTIRPGKAGNYSSADWDMNAGFDGAFEMARAGWPDGARQVKEMAGNFENICFQELTKSGYKDDVAGDFYEVGRVVSGDPECAITKARVKREMPAIKITITGGARGEIDAKTYFRRGAAIVALIDVLEASGIRCLVVLGYQNTPHANKKEFINKCSIVLKEHEDALDVDRISFAISHPASLRQVNFAVREGLPADWVNKFGFKNHDGWGVTHTFEDKDADILMPKMFFDNDQEAVDWVKKQAEKFIK